MKQLEFRPPVFLLTGLLWLVLSALLGLVLYLTTIVGLPLPSILRLLHVHGALVGGVAQIILGAMLAFIPPLLMTGGSQPRSHPVLYVAINAGAVGLVAGFWQQNRLLIAAGGLLVFFAFLSLAGNAFRQTRESLVSPPLNLWFYGIALLSLLSGLGLGIAMASGMVSPELMGRIRLAHLHLNVQGFIALTIVGTMHNLFPTVLNVPLHSPRLARLTFFLLPAGIAALLAGFLMGKVPVDLAAGVVLLIGVALYAYNIVRTWLAAGRPRSAPADHLLLATFFLVLTVAAGILVGINALWDPPAVPFGTLHLIAYTHLAFIGFIAQTIIGALSHLLPVSLAVQRVESSKKRGPYLEELTRLVEQWRSVQVGALNLGTVGLALVAALVWQYTLGSTPVKIGTFVTAGLLLLGIGLFAGKVVLLLNRRPPE
jgi:cbb3-type cytochrome oxidase subunit 1